MSLLSSEKATSEVSGVSPKELEAGICAPKFTAALFTVARSNLSVHPQTRTTNVASVPAMAHHQPQTGHNTEGPGGHHAE